MMVNLYKRAWPLVTIISLIFILTSCSAATNRESKDHFPNAVFYEIFVHSFADSNGDGIGDLRGIMESLDELKNLGIEAIWLTPIHPSPSYHKYDVVDYYSIDPEYGTLEDFKELIEAAHKRNIRILLDLVVNHTSSQHPWFQAASGSKESPYRNWYIWAGPETRLNEVGDWGQKLWYSNGNDHYYAIFDKAMPDLNLDHPGVREEMIKIGQYWLNLGIDGFRLDAAMHIYPAKEKEKNYAWWQEFETAMRKVKKDVFIVGEIWTTTAEIGPYLTAIPSAFNFDLSSKIITSVEQERDAGIVTSLQRTREFYKANRADFIDAIFLTNHDMDRVMSVLKSDLNQAKMAASLLLTLPGSPFLYYGEELGMQGRKPDERIREPFPWGVQHESRQTRWIVPRYNRSDIVTPLDAQLQDENSLYQHYKKMIQLRRSNDILALGEIAGTNIREQGIVAFRRAWQNQSLLVIHNLSRREVSLDIKGDEASYKREFFRSRREIEMKIEKDGLHLLLPAYSTIILQK
jgi:glycosidase